MECDFINTLYRGDLSMNKRIVSALVLAGMIASTSAFASKARELVLGQGGAEVVSGYGSFYYDDVYNMFYNPAYINDYKNWVAFEKGTVGNAEFGFASSMMNFNMGLYFNRFGGTQNLAAADGDASIVDLMFGGDTGVKWGLGLNYGASKSSAIVDHNFFGARVGVSVAGFDPFIGFTLAAQDKALGTKTNTYNDMNAGIRYHYGEWVPYAVFNSAKTKVEATTIETKTSAYALGIVVKRSSPKALASFTPSTTSTAKRRRPTSRPLPSWPSRCKRASKPTLSPGSLSARA